MPWRRAKASAFPFVGDATATTSISSGIALTDAAMQSAWKREPTMPILTLDTICSRAPRCHQVQSRWLERGVQKSASVGRRIEFDVAAAGASKRRERQLLLRAKLDPSEEALALRPAPRPPCLVHLVASPFGNVPTFHRLLAFRAAGNCLRHSCRC